TRNRRQSVGSDSRGNSCRRFPRHERVQGPRPGTTPPAQLQRVALQEAQVGQNDRLCEWAQSCRRPGKEQTIVRAIQRSRGPVKSLTVSTLYKNIVRRLTDPVPEDLKRPGLKSCQPSNFTQDPSERLATGHSCCRPHLQLRN